VLGEIFTTNLLLSIIEQLSPLPENLKRCLTSRTRWTEVSAILTSSPYKERLERKVTSTHEPAKKGRKKLMSHEQLACDKGEKDLRPNEQESTTECIICGETFNDGWIQFESYNYWAHENCTHIESTDIHYTCDHCILRG